MSSLTTSRHLALNFFTHVENALADHPPVRLSVLLLLVLLSAGRYPFLLW